MSVQKLTPATDIVYLVLNYERGPLFARFEVARVQEHRLRHAVFDWFLAGGGLSGKAPY
ncbi:MAG: hypothetical protein MZW92_09555 [Comamonadaceae bacterium]|nr:hypothetical protein [Comamonadaceae bacterium]